MIDERFISHRFKSTSHAAVVASVLLCFFFLRDYYGHGIMRLDLLTTMCAMAVTKMAAMVYYRRTE
jgi:hypothetical protein